jgi:hypothetical protein
MAQKHMTHSGQLAVVKIVPICTNRAGGLHSIITTIDIAMRKRFMPVCRARWRSLCLFAIISALPAAAQNPFRAIPDAADAFGAPPNTTVCPRIKPFRCENGDCVTNPTKCMPTADVCPSDRPLRCSDGACVSNNRACSTGGSSIRPGVRSDLPDFGEPVK